MKRRIIGVVTALLLASIGTLTLVAWANSAQDRALAGERTVNVLVVRQDVAKGTRAEDLATSVELERVPAKVQAVGSVTDLGELAGRVASADLLVGEQIIAARFADPQVLARQADVEIPDGLQEVTVSLEPQRAVGGKLRAGSTVGLIASFDPFDMDGGTTDEETAKKTPNETHFILHKVLVTRVQAAPVTAPKEDPNAEGAAPDPLPAGSLLITLAVDAPSAERIVFAQEFGRLWFTAEPETATEDGTSIKHRGNIFE